MTILLTAAALILGYTLGAKHVPARIGDQLEDWARRRTSRLGVAAAQPVYLLLIIGHFAANPARCIRNVKANRELLRRHATRRAGAMAAPTDGPRGLCPYCGATPRLLRDGTLRTHPAAGTTARPGYTANCQGSKKPPKERA